METADCLFCKIVARNIPATVVFEDDAVIAFNDIYPKAPVHVLIVPKRHVASIADLAPADGAFAGQLLMTARNLAEKLGIAADGYRLVCNVRKHGGQVVDHIHLHLLGGKPLGHGL